MSRHLCWTRKRASIAWGTRSRPASSRCVTISIPEKSNEGSNTKSTQYRPSSQIAGHTLRHGDEREVQIELGDQQSARRADQPQQNIFGQQLAQHPNAAGAQRGAHGNLRRLSGIESSRSQTNSYAHPRKRENCPRLDTTGSALDA